MYRGAVSGTGGEQRGNICGETVLQRSLLLVCFAVTGLIIETHYHPEREAIYTQTQAAQLLKGSSSSSSGLIQRQRCSSRETDSSLLCSVFVCFSVHGRSARWLTKQFVFRGKKTEESKVVLPLVPSAVAIHEPDQHPQVGRESLLNRTHHGRACTELCCSSY